MLMRLFAVDNPGHHGKPSMIYQEFCNLWSFLGAWRDLFEQFDQDRSGKISLDEFSDALRKFGYDLTPTFISTLYNTYNNRGLAQVPRQTSYGRRESDYRLPEGMSFDLFVQACISLKRMTEVFKRYDDDRDGWAIIKFEDFLTEMIRLRE